jgi:hypothetical protein
MLREHPPFFDPPQMGRALVVWYTRTSMACLGKDFYECTHECWAGLTARVKQLEQDGEPTKYVGHQLRPPYRKIFEFTPRHHRFLAFRCAHRFFITNGNWKRDNQDPDYEIALACQIEFFSDPDTLHLRRDQ